MKRQQFNKSDRLALACRFLSFDLDHTHTHTLTGEEKSNKGDPALGVIDIGLENYSQSVQQTLFILLLKLIIV